MISKCHGRKAGAWCPLLKTCLRNMCPIEGKVSDQVWVMPMFIGDKCENYIKTNRKGDLR